MMTITYEQSYYISMKTTNPDPFDPHDAVMLAKGAERLARKRQQTREWQVANPDKVRSYYHSDKGRAVRDAYYNSERGKEVRRLGQIRNADKVRERNRLRAQTPKGKAYNKAYNETYYSSPRRRVRHMVFVAKTRARIAGLEFDSHLIDLIENNIPTHCPCCGVEIEYVQTKRGMNNPSLDRVDNSKGYIVGNAFTVCFRCNLMKSDGSVKDFENILAYMKARIPKENW